jgi:hypothetical protein
VIFSHYFQNAHHLRGDRKLAALKDQHGFLLVPLSHPSTSFVAIISKQKQYKLLIQPQQKILLSNFASEPEHQIQDGQQTKE